MELEQSEKEFLVNLLSQLTIKPASEDAQRTVATIQSILGKLNGRKA